MKETHNFQTEFSNSFKNKTFYKPRWVKIKLTERCNLRCVKCNYRLNESTITNNGAELTLEEILNIIDQLEILNIEKIKFLGGEATIRKDLSKIISYCSSKKIKTQLTTNGYFIDEKLATKLVEAGLSKILISIDSHLSHVHDELTGVIGSWNKTMSSFLHLSKAKKMLNTKIQIVASSVIDSGNFEFIEDLFYFLSSLFVDGIIFNRINTDELDDKSNGLSKEQIDLFSNVILNQLLKQAESKNIHFSSNFGSSTELEKNYNYIYDKIPCYSSYFSFYISAIGNVYPCCSIKQKEFWMGNIRTEKIADIVNNDKFKQFRKKCLPPIEFSSCKSCFDMNDDNLEIDNILKNL